MVVQLPSKDIPLYSLRIKWDDIKRIYSKLSRDVEEQADREISELTEKDDEDTEQYKRRKETVKEKSFKITVSIYGNDGKSLHGDSIEIFNSVNLPENISSIYMTNITAYRSFSGVNPIAGFELNLDFSKPPLLDSRNPVSNPTLNRSRLFITGDRDSWIATIERSVMEILNNRTTWRAWLHKGFVYDIGLLVLGLPSGLYAAWMLSDLVEETFGQMHSIISATAYIYIVLMTLWAYRILFGYTKWAFPIVELEESRDSAKTHRRVLGSFILAYIGKVLHTIT